MMDWSELLNWFLGRDSQPLAPAEPPPEPEEKWELKSRLHTEMHGTPWQYEREIDPVIVTIRDVREGFVRYYHGDGKLIQDSAEPIQLFMRIFKRCDP